MNRYTYKLQILDGEEWTETVYDQHPSAELEKACDENKVWKLTITKRKTI